MIAAVFIVGSVGFVGFEVADAHLGEKRIAKDVPPDFEFVRGETDAVYAVFDGLAGHPEKRFAEVAGTVFGKHNVLYVNPGGDRYDLEWIIQSTSSELERLRREVFGEKAAIKVVPTGGSLGAKCAYRLTQILDSSYPNLLVEEVKFIDPLYSGKAVKNFFAPMIAAWHPGPMQNQLFSPIIGPLVTGKSKPTNGHMAYAFTMKASRVADEVREAKRGPILGKLSPSDKRLRISIIYVTPKNDEVLRSQAMHLGAVLVEQGHHVDYNEVTGGTHHMGIDTEPEVWRKALEKGLVN